MVFNQLSTDLFLEGNKDWFLRITHLLFHYREISIRNSRKRFTLILSSVDMFYWIQQKDCGTYFYRGIEISELDTWNAFQSLIWCTIFNRWFNLTKHLHICSEVVATYSQWEVQLFYCHTLDYTRKITATTVAPPWNGTKQFFIWMNSWPIIRAISLFGSDSVINFIHSFMRYDSLQSTLSTRLANRSSFIAFSEWLPITHCIDLMRPHSVRSKCLFTFRIHCINLHAWAQTLQLQQRFQVPTRRLF